MTNPPAEFSYPPSDLDRCVRTVVCIAMLLGAGVLLFPNLGHYALWDDEAITAMTSMNVWHTGDTGVRFGHNLVLYRNGLLTGDTLADRYTSPLQFYLTAPFVGWIGPTALAARLPFALCGLITIGVLCRWMFKARTGATLSVLIAMGALGNVSLFLFARTCRYYALATLLAMLVAYFYVHFDRRRRTLVGLVVASLLLMSCNYLSFVAVWGCIGLDFLLWGRKTIRPTWRDILVLGTTHLVVGLMLVRVWNPLGKDASSFGAEDWLVNRILLLGWTLRDMARAEFVALPLFVIALPLAWWRGNRLLLRGVLAFFAFVVVTVVLSPQDLRGANEADLRYLTPVLPLGIALAAVVVRDVGFNRLLPCLLIGLVVFGTNVVQTLGLSSTGLRSTVALYVRELAHPLPEPYTPTIDWVRTHVGFGQTVRVVPDHMVYPLMFHAPQPVYAWQLIEPVKPSLASLPDVHFTGRNAPDYVIAFGPSNNAMKTDPSALAPLLHRYDRVAVLNVYYDDLYRPELIWRTFSPKPIHHPDTEAIHIYKRVSLTLSDDTTPTTSPHDVAPSPATVVVTTTRSTESQRCTTRTSASLSACASRPRS
jgi:hypothetical protein